MTGAASGWNGGSRLRSVLIGLLADGPIQPVNDLTDHDWCALDRLAGLHRLGPLLHHRHNAHAAIPPAVRDGWREAFREASFRSLQIAGELAATVSLLEGAGHART